MSEPVRILVGDVRDGLASLPERSVHCCVTSPPYWGLRDYGVDGQIGLEESPERFVETMVEVFRAVRRVLRDDGTLWLNLGDSYAGSAKGGHPGDKSTLDGYTGSQDQARHAGATMASRRRDDAPMPRPLSDRGASGLKPKDLCMMPWRVAMALQADGWWLRSVIVWAKKSPMPESCRDRPTSSWEPIFLLAKSERYFYDAEAVKEAGSRYEWGTQKFKGGDLGKHHGSSRGGETADPTAGRNMRNVWHLGPEPYAEAHFATFPTEIPRRAIKAGTSEKGCCPKCGAPWERVTARATNGMDVENADDRTGELTAQRMGKAKCPDGLRVASRTVGWEPGCACGAGDPVPCVVLDPFLGSGTTVAVARQLGRWGVGCELNPEYVELARARIGKAERPHTFRDTRETADDAGGLFATRDREGVGAEAGAEAEPTPCPLPLGGGEV